ncbi:hypothetical protein RhiLY_06512 [Ceratobasidium sp. AG-Ba]|nr:hypothetical protein RhiLY_06512 [Ceratobasidium sp. AG-Ba]
MAAHNLTPIPNLAARQSGESKIVTPASTIPAPPPTNPIAARRVSNVEASELNGKRITGWTITQERDEPVPMLVLLVKGDNDQTATRYELHVAARNVPRRRLRILTSSPTLLSSLPICSGLTNANRLMNQARVESEPGERALGVRIISAALVPRPGRSWENNGAIRMVDQVTLRLILEPVPEESESVGTAASHARSASTSTPKTVFVRARTTERDRAPSSKVGTHVPNDGSDEEADHVGDRTSIVEDVILLRV